MIRALRDKLNAGGEDSEDVKSLAHVLFDAAVLESGYQPDDPKAVTARMQVGLARKAGC